jgi:hypothetical protein
MKTLILAALVAASTAPAAFANNSQLLSNTDIAEIKQIVPNADLSNLTSAQAAFLSAALNNDGPGDNVGGQIRSILNAGPVDASRGAVSDATDYVPGGKSRGSDR